MIVPFIVGKPDSQKEFTHTVHSAEVYDNKPWTTNVAPTITNNNHVDKYIC